VAEAWAEVGIVVPLDDVIPTRSLGAMPRARWRLRVSPAICSSL
jgi:hypothetical protein